MFDYIDMALIDDIDITTCMIDNIDIALIDLAMLWLIISTCFA